jgi:hypothetical protein
MSSRTSAILVVEPGQGKGVGTVANWVGPTAGMVSWPGGAWQSLHAARAYQSGGVACSGGVAFLPMMEAPDVWDRHDGSAIAGRRDRTRNRRVLFERQMRAGPFVVRTVQDHQLPHARFAQHDDMVEALATSGSKKSLDECILPRRARGREHVLNSHRLCSALQAVKRVIAIMDQISGRLIPRKCLAQLLSRRRCRMCGDRDVSDAPIVGKEHQHEHER